METDYIEQINIRQKLEKEILELRIQNAAIESDYLKAIKEKIGLECGLVKQKVALDQFVAKETVSLYADHLKCERETSRKRAANEKTHFLAMQEIEKTKK